MSQLYDRTDIYDLVESDQRTEIIRKDWADFLGDREIHTLLDVSIGTGSMTLALQELGISLCGSDLSEAMLSRCETKAAAKGKQVELKCSDFRDLSCWEGRQFDCVASTGNSLGYVENNDVLLALEKQNLVPPADEHTDVFVVALGDAAQAPAFKLLEDCRHAGLTANMDYAGRSMKAQMKQANKHHARYALILGEDEVANGTVQVKDMEKSEQKSVALEDVIGVLMK